MDLLNEALALLLGYAAAWAVFAAPQDPLLPLHGVARGGFELLWFGSGAGAFWAVGRHRPALLLIAGWLLNALVQTWG